MHRKIEQKKCILIVPRVRRKTTLEIVNFFVSGSTVRKQTTSDQHGVLFCGRKRVRLLRSDSHDANAFAGAL